MIQLVPMDETEFQIFLNTAIQSYANDHIQTGKYSAEDALQRATAEFEEFLPDGLASADQYLFLLKDEASNQKVGILWFGVNRRQAEPFAFVLDIIIYEQFRRRGYAEQAFKVLEEKVRALGMHKIGLHVFGHNQAARALYEKLGYYPTNITMLKDLNYAVRPDMSYP